MIRREMGKTGEKVSALGFGCMRLPTRDDQSIDVDEATRMLRFAIDNGVDYVDTAWGYHNGQSEPFVGSALQDGYRDKVNLATKLPSWLIKCREDMDYYLNEQLRRLRTDVIDFYLIHALNRRYWKNLKEHDIFEFMDSALASGRIRHIGFSFHDTLDVFKEIIDSYGWEFCQIQYNFVDTEHQAGLEGLKYAADKGIGVAVMEPLRGGKLATNVRDDILSIWTSSGIDRTPAAWALRWVWNDPDVGVVLSGMSTMDQVRENIETAREASPNSMSSSELAIVDRVREEYKKRIKVSCTGCSYCMPCPSGVAIPTCFDFFNDAYMFDSIEDHKKAYLRSVKKENRASLCVECGRCEELCPQNIPIIEQLKEVSSLFE
ncbi:putative oxidoreductase of aldo/keto reductase family [Mesotoga prima MesG1.Ag.4.2]|uniref:Putative oxidoreductase of aldo/keto reductase family n=1 Tax=Mesotoga prima MesG1.Ag.4.2 TaxID=660470 RepID=I2F430_9BACT|nr:aldo/keto reductase [Mesotoga prima]AFK06683.1 putative oxidoreductase of aldo/keto reductase family [Mesotoga prima MesG1.Ag.4.2]